MLLHFFSHLCSSKPLSVANSEGSSSSTQMFRRLAWADVSATSSCAGVCFDWARVSLLKHWLCRSHVAKQGKSKNLAGHDGRQSYRYRHSQQQVLDDTTDPQTK